ncbi:DUF4199 domain-containing protein [Mesonia aquimarina]|uniref:DUF4199 domain-containing protein n=1 Tax=Mesonia aquimarina TaxID=1504967 RepID=UPI000EF58946|nr:DUF4199 domain-containing protein [Mesonia aquimarina]
MKKTILKFGSYGLLMALILFLLALWLGMGLSYSVQEIVGYATMLASLSFIFFGIKHFRDHVNNGEVSFGKALLIGLGIAVLAGVGIGIADFIYTSEINPDFMTEYMDYSLANLKETLPPEEFQLQKEKLEAEAEMMGSPFMMAFIMFATVFVIGLIISLLSALILQRKK